MVHAGDLVVADAAGVVFVPKESADEILKRLVTYKQKNADYLAGVKKGVFSNQWVDDLLDDSGCIVTP